MEKEFKINGAKVVFFTSLENGNNAFSFRAITSEADANYDLVEAEKPYTMNDIMYRGGYVAVDEYYVSFSDFITFCVKNNVFGNEAAVAIMEGIQYREREFELKTGDRLFLYTDGVPEATNTENELYGTDRMIETLNRDTGRPLPQVLQMLKEDIDSFVGEAPQFDDVTMLVFDYYGPKGKEHADERDAD